MRGARETDERRRTLFSTSSEEVERNEANGPFSPGCIVFVHLAGDPGFGARLFEHLPHDGVLVLVLDLIERVAVRDCLTISSAFNALSDVLTRPSFQPPSHVSCQDSKAVREQTLQERQILNQTRSLLACSLLFQ